MAGTFAFDAKQALVDKIKADTTNFGDLVTADAIWYGYQGAAHERPREVVWIGEIEWDYEVGVGIGYQRRDEQFRIMITIESHVPGDTQEQANARVETRMQALEALLRNPRALGLSIMEHELKPQLLGEGADSEGRGAILVLSLQVKARKS